MVFIHDAIIKYFKKNREEYEVISNSPNLSRLKRVKFSNYNEYCRLIFVKNLLENLYHDSKTKVSIIDVGGGEGNLGFLLNRKKFNYLLLENSRENIRLASKNGIKTKFYDGHKLPFKDNYFDSVLCIHTLEHVRNERLRNDLCAEVKRLAKRNVILIFPYGHISRFFEALCMRILRLIGVTPRNVSEHLMLTPVDMIYVKNLFNGAKVKHSGNNILWLITRILRATYPRLMLKLIHILDPFFQRIYRIGPYRDVVLIYIKPKES